LNMKKLKLTPEEQERKDRTWKRICIWHDDHPFWILGAVIGYILLIMYRAIHCQNDKDAVIKIIVVSIVGGILVFLGIRWLIKEIFCHTKNPYQKNLE
jgi:hypothetical protein